MSETTKTLAVRSEAQRVLFVEELAGQISDGYWENSRPHDHWRPWCDAEVVVDPDRVGRDFWAQKTNYDFAARMLVEVVGDRMIEAVRAKAGLPDYGQADLLADLRDLKTIARTFRR
jgi:hypothetical protein